MIGVSLVVVTVTVVGLAILCVVAARPALEGATAGPFADAPAGIDLASDTLTGYGGDMTLTGHWQEVELSRLSEVEDFLDALEARNVQERELAVVGNDKFVVRWR